MTDGRLVSVIIPVYNTEKYLAECLDSLAAQTYTNYEAIIVDDGSTDGSPAICDAYAAKDARFRVIHKENGGLSEARNTGLDAAKGEFIYFYDSDDRIVPQTLEHAVKALIDTEADFLFFDSASFEDSSLGFDIPQNYKRKTAYLPDSGLSVFEKLQKNGDLHLAVQMYLYRSSFLKKTLLRFYPGILYEDMVFSFEAFCRAVRVAHCHESLYERRFRPGSIMTAKPGIKNYESALTVYREVARIAGENGCADRSGVKKYVSRCAYRVFELYSGLSAENKKKEKPAQKGFSAEIKKADGHGDRALYCRRLGKLPWAACRAVQKLKRRK